ncbi:hypothetical protein A8C32_07240 [Flavivirga aquatica]|uniref:DUF1343 domain-containing protein n=1 Tax=Flavivirga aquatica TaxID=1849968 RepID=A0A1E5SIN4_9FLAO|nr:DUF1343 domain-containing protein [Flavivirga aquatica]OEJ98970.1 hypothetical protein A8C32_07240 [Flavivirga aquatica]
MRFNIFKNTVLLFVLVMISCANLSKPKDQNKKTKEIQNKKTLTKKLTPIVGANQFKHYLPLLKEKRVGIVANQTSVVFKGENNFTHLVDSLLALNINVKKVFAPEHGFRGSADAGEVVKDGIDTKTNLPIVSLYGKNKKPSKEQLQGLDIVIFDIQDVGARFYTYISSLHYVMEACAEQGIPVIILDRPNPNGHYIDGPILEKEHKSFVGMHPIPIAHGMTIGEYAKMINGEKWLANNVQCKLTIIPIKNYNHKLNYSLPIKPSPNLPNDKSINLYPSLCFFEGTNVSIGRGTNKQFQVIGSPFFFLKGHHYEFIPKPNYGAKYPKHENKICHGYDLSNYNDLEGINLKWLIEFYNANKQYAPKETFFSNFFTKLAGTKKLQQQIEVGMTEKAIKKTWISGLEKFKKTRENYLIYP